MNNRFRLSVSFPLSLSIYLKFFTNKVNTPCLNFMSRVYNVLFLFLYCSSQYSLVRFLVVLNETIVCHIFVFKALTFFIKRLVGAPLVPWRSRQCCKQLHESVPTYTSQNRSHRSRMV